MSAYPTGTVTFLFTDIEGSTKLWQEYPQQMKVNLARHDDLLRQSIERNEGYVFKTVGDAFCAAFPTAWQGVKAAIESQQALAQENWGGAVIKVRMGLHTGDAEERDNDYFGTTLNRTARLMSAGHGGQTLLSQATQELVSGDLPPNVSLRDLGKHRLKDLIHPEHIFQLDVAGLLFEFLPLKTLDIQLNNLPTQLTHFIGRDREIAAVLRLLRTPDVHLVTLTGAGGMGKTRLSLQVAADLLDEFEHGVWFVELASLTDPELVQTVIASTLKIKVSAGMPIAQALNEYLRDKSLLLVLDNFEQVITAAPVITGMLNAAPKVKVLVSSREVLRLRGEHSYPVPPLGLPESKRKQTAAVLAQYEAIALFVEHAQAVNPSFVLDEDNAITVAEICMKLDGLPLALELAAARSRLLKPAVMLEKLKKSLDMLTRGARDLPRRQQTIRGAIDWSYELLDEVEKRLFARLGVFVGGWTVESAEAVCGSGLALDVLAGIESLLDKSLVRQMEGVSGETRFAMLETIREYAHEKLSQSGELPSIQQAHAEHLGQLLQNVFDALNGPEESSWFVKLDDEIENLRFIVNWTLAHQQPSLVFKAVRPWHYWDSRGNYRDPVEWMEQALVFENKGDPMERAQALGSLGGIFAEFGNSDKEYLLRARKCQEDSMAIYRELGDADGVAKSMVSLGNILWKEKNIEAARECFEKVLEMQSGLVSWGNSITLLNLGNLATLRCDYQEARTYLMHSREMSEQMGTDKGIFFADWSLGKLALAQRKLEEVQMHINSTLENSFVKASPLPRQFMQSYLGYVQILLGNQQEGQTIFTSILETVLELHEQTGGVLGDIGDDWYLYDGQARLELMDKNYERAAQLFGVAWARREEGSYPIFEAEHLDYEARIAEVRSAIGDAAFHAAFQKGQAMQIKDALIFALEKIQ